MYTNYLNPTFDYFGFTYDAPPTIYLAIAWILSLLPGLWMPLNIARPSQVAYWILYVTVIIPSMFVPLYVRLETPAELCELMIIIFCGFTITGLSYVFPLFGFRAPRISHHTFWWCFALISLGSIAWILAVFRNNLSVVSFLDIYDLRSGADDLMQSSLVGYAVMWLSSAIAPFLMGWGLYHKRLTLFLTGALGQVLVYSCVGTKASITSIVFMAAIFVLLRVGRSPFGLKLIWGLLGLGITLSIFGGVNSVNPGLLKSLLLFLVFMRTLSINGLATAQYYDFFLRNPVTYFSHVKVINAFVSYPYSQPIGVEVGAFYSGDPSLDATAHFWASDGIAGMGLLGILLVSVLCCFVFWGLDSLAQHHPPHLAALVLSFEAFNLANINLFTTLLSGGLGLLALCLYFAPRGLPTVNVEGNGTRALARVPRPAPNAV